MMCLPRTVTCEEKHVHTSLEPTTFDPFGRTLISVRLVLASVRKQRHDLTLRELRLVLAANPAYKQIEVGRPDEWYVEGVSRTLSSYAPVSVSASLDGVDMKLDACVVMDKFPPGSAWNLRNYDATT